MQTNTTPAAVLSFVSDTLTESLNQAPPDSLDDLRVTALVNSRAISMQLSLAEQLHDVTLESAEKLPAAAKLLRVLTLLDRAQARAQRSLPKPLSSEFTAQREDAHRFLESELASGPRPALEMIAAAKKLGIAQRTLTRAKSDLNILSRHIQGDDKGRCWMWSLAPAPTPSPA